MGFWENTDQTKSQWQEEKRFEPSMSKDEAEQFLYTWNKAVEKSKNWIE